MDGFKEVGMAEWDQRQAFHMRLHETILLCHQGNIKEDYQLWLKAINVLYNELYSHMKPKERSEIEDFIKKGRLLIKDPKSIASCDFFFNKAQRSLHQVMRNKGFDVPIVSRDPGDALKYDRG